MLTGTIPPGIHSSAVTRCNNTTSFPTLRAIVEVHLDHTRTDNFGSVQCPLLGLDKHDAAEGADEESLLLSHLEKLSLTLPRGGGFDRAFLSLYEEYSDA